VLVLVVLLLLLCCPWWLVGWLVTPVHTREKCVGHCVVLEFLGVACCFHQAGAFAPSPKFRVAWSATRLCRLELKVK
jgi:hypothetical protein